MNLFIFLLVLLGILMGFALGVNITTYDNNPSEPTKVCREGKLYKVTHEGNITIFDRSDFMTCEEIK